MNEFNLGFSLAARRISQHWVRVFFKVVRGYRDVLTDCCRCPPSLPASSPMVFVGTVNLDISFRSSRLSTTGARLVVDGRANIDDEFALWAAALERLSVEV